MAMQQLPSSQETAILNQQNSGLKVQTAVEIMMDNEDRVCYTLPHRPEGGQIYLFQPSSPDHSEDWKSDGHMLVILIILIM